VSSRLCMRYDTGRLGASPWRPDRLRGSEDLWKDGKPGSDDNCETSGRIQDNPVRKVNLQHDA
jgi:hypothetical protein